MANSCYKCQFIDISHLDDPCFKCLSWHSSYRPCYKREEPKKKIKGKQVRKKEPVIQKDENTPLPWSN